MVEAQSVETILPVRSIRSVTGGWAPPYLALALPPLVLLADTLVAVAGGWRPMFRIDLLFVFALVSWLVLITTILALPAGRRFFARYRPQLVLLVGSVCFAWLVGEAAVGAILGRLVDPFHCSQPGSTRSHRPSPKIMRGVAPQATARYNGWGVRGPNPPPRDRAYRILCVGGSSTACSYLDDTKTWARLLADDLHADDPEHAYWAGNIGVPGFDTSSHLLFARTSPLVDQVDCLVVQAGINDFMACLIGPRPRPPVWTHSPIRQAARALWFRRLGTATLVEDASGTVYERRRKLRQSAAIDLAAPDLTACLRHFEQDLTDLVDTCRERNVRLVFTSQPTLWRDDLDAENAALLWFGLMRDGRYLSVPQLRVGMDRYNEVVRRVAREHEIELVELSALDGDPVMFYDDCHFTEAGAQQVARLVADALKSRPNAPAKESAP